MVHSMYTIGAKALRVYHEVQNDVEKMVKIICGILNWSKAKKVLSIENPIKSKIDIVRFKSHVRK